MTPGAWSFSPRPTANIQTSCTREHPSRHFALQHASSGPQSDIQDKFGVPQSRCLPIAGRPTTNHAKNTPLRGDVYGYFLKSVTGAKYGGIRQLHDSIVNLLSRWLKRVHVPHKVARGATPRPAKTPFQSRSIG